MSVNLDIIESAVVPLQATKREWYIIAIQYYKRSPLTAYGFTSEVDRVCRPIADPLANATVDITMMDLPLVLDALGSGTVELMQVTYNGLKSKLDILQDQWQASDNEEDRAKGDYLKSLDLSRSAREKAYLDGKYNEAKSTLKFA